MRYMTRKTARIPLQDRNFPIPQNVKSQFGGAKSEKSIVYCYHWEDIDPPRDDMTIPSKFLRLFDRTRVKGA